MVDIHLIVTRHEEYGVSADSPQIPGLVGAWDTADEFFDVLPSILELAPADRGKVWLHEQIIAVAPNGDEYLVRAALEHSDALYNTVGRVLNAVSEGRLEEFADQQPQIPTGERILVAALPEDPLGFFFDQMIPGYGLTIECNPHAPDLTWSIFVSSGVEVDGFMNVTLAELGLSRDSTVNEALAILPSLTVAGEPLLLHA